jgi:hypothetical protein
MFGPLVMMGEPPRHEETEIWKSGEKENINLIEIENAERKRMGWT